MSAGWGRVSMRWGGGVAAALVLGMLIAAQKPEDQPPTVRYAAQIEDAADTARRTRDAHGAMEGDYGRYGGFVKLDMARYKEACEATAVIFEQIAQAYRVGDIEEVRRLRVQADEAEKTRNLWKYRITELRVKQATAAVNEQWFVQESRYLMEGLLPYLLAMEEAKKSAAEAWGRAAEAFKPGADLELAEQVREEAFAAEGEREIAVWRWEWAIQRERIWTDKTIKSADMLKAIAQLQTAQERRVQLRRDEIERDRRGREVERQIRAGEKAFHLAYDAAVREKKK